MKAKTKTTKKTIKNKPLTISVHGDGIDIDARIASDGGGGKSKGPSAFDQLFEQIAAKFATPGPISAEPAATIEKFGTSLTDPQIDVIVKALTDEQVALFDQIMSFAGLTPWSDEKGMNGHTAEPAENKQELDFDVVARVIDHASPDILRSIVNLANIKLGNDPAPAAGPVS